MKTHRLRNSLWTTKNGQIENVMFSVCGRQFTQPKRGQLATDWQDVDCCKCHSLKVRFRPTSDPLHRKQNHVD